MYIKLMIVSLIFINSSWASETSVTFGLMKYQINLDKKKTELKGKNLSISLDRSKCNSDIYDQFKKNVEHTLEIMPTHSGSSVEKVEVISGTKKSFFDPSSPKGKYFLTLPDLFKKTKIQSSLKCAQMKKK
jgi:hypothetical protein